MYKPRPRASRREQVEELVTRPVESAINGASGLATMRSESIPGLSVVTVTFDDGVNPYIARQAISERLAQLGSAMPTGAGTPKLSPLVSSTMDLLKIGLVSDKVDAYALRDAADWLVKPRLLAVPGVARHSHGYSPCREWRMRSYLAARVRELQIVPNMEQLARLNLTLTDLIDSARASLAVRGADSWTSPRSAFS